MTWYHDQDRMHFFLKDKNRITHCYHHEHSSDDFYRWWKVDIPKRPRRGRKLTEVVAGSKTAYQLLEIQKAGCPPAVWFYRHALQVLDHKPALWNNMLSFLYQDEDFEPVKTRLGTTPGCGFLSDLLPAADRFKHSQRLDSVLNQMSHLGYKDWDCGCKRIAANAVMTRNYPRD